MIFDNITTAAKTMTRQVTKISYNGVEIDLGKPFARMTMIDAIKKYAGVDFDQVPDDAAAKKLADEHHIEYEERHKKGDIVNLFFEEYCEKELIQQSCCYLCI